jgi:6-phosphogluconolactonase
VNRDLKPSAFVSTGGREPRGFQLTPDGRLLLVANQNSNNVVTFAVDEATGGLEATGVVTDVPSPTCVVVFGS